MVLIFQGNKSEVKRSQMTPKMNFPGTLNQEHLVFDPQSDFRLFLYKMGFMFHLEKKLNQKSTRPQNDPKNQFSGGIEPGTFDF